MALSICSIVMLGLSAILTSVAQGWTYTENTQGYVMAESAGMMRIERLLRNSRLTGAHHPGSVDGVGQPAYLVLWAEDRQPNGAVDVGEIAIIEHDRDTRTVRVWEIPGQTALHNQELERSLLDDPGNVEVFKEISAARPRTLAVNVAAMALWVHPAVVDHQKPEIEYAVVFDRPVRRGTSEAAQVTHYGSAAMRLADSGN